MSDSVSFKRALISNFSQITAKDAELLLCQCFPREMDELEEMGDSSGNSSISSSSSSSSSSGNSSISSSSSSSSSSTSETSLSHNVEIVSSAIQSKYLQLKPILQNLESHTLLIRSWVTFISHEFSNLKSIGIITSEEAFSKLQEVVNYCKQSLDSLSAYFSQNEELQEKCKSYRDNSVYCQEADYLNKRHSDKIDSMPQEMKEKFVVLSGVVLNILLVIRPTRSACSRTLLNAN